MVYSSGATTFPISREKFLLIGSVWIAIMEGDGLPEKTCNHVAFKIPDDEHDAFLERVSSLGAEIRERRSRVAEEGCSSYFYDYDNHLFERHTGTLDQRLAHYRAAPPHPAA